MERLLGINIMELIVLLLFLFFITYVFQLMFGLIERTPKTKRDVWITLIPGSIFYWIYEWYKELK